MKNYLKKFSVMFVMALMLMFGWSISAFADDKCEIGKINLNGTSDVTQNSAKIGDQLTSPEVGWKRYDDSNSLLKYTDASHEENISINRNYATNINYWNSTRSGITRSSSNSKAELKFNFYGNAIRIISDKYHTCRTNKINVTIDGNSEEVNLIDNANILLETQIIQYDNSNKNLRIGKHTVVITAEPSDVGRGFIVDAIDVKEGNLLPYNESITLDKATMNLNIKDTQQLAATTTPAGAQVTWKSSDSSVATVDSTGKVTGVKEGSCTITATTADGLTATCVVTVTKENKSISLNKTSTNLTIDDSETLIATTTPTGISVKWSSSDTSVATVDSNGKVTAIGAGTATIIATTLDGSNLSASCLVTVVPKGNDPAQAGSEYITNIAHAKGTNTNNPGGEVTIIFHGTADTTLSVVKTADVKDVWIGDNFTYTLVITNTGTKTAKAVVVNDPAPNHIDFNVSGVTTTQGSVDSSSTSKNVIVNVGDILPGGTVTIKIPSTVIA